MSCLKKAYKIARRKLRRLRILGIGLEESKHVFDYLVKKLMRNISNLMLALEKIVGHNDMLAYLTMMTVRLIELTRVLKKTGSLYLHCDPTASHYLKIVLDAIFGKNNFRNEIIWNYRKWISHNKL